MSMIYFIVALFFFFIFCFRSKNNTIRAGCANLIIRLIERLGAINAISSPDFGKLVSVLIAFAKDPSPTVRQHGKHGLQLLSQVGASFNFQFPSQIKLH